MISPNGEFVSYPVEAPGCEPEYHVARLDGTDRVKVTGDLVTGGQVVDFQWAPDSSAVSFRAQEQSNDTFRLYVNTPDGDSKEDVSGALMVWGYVDASAWTPR